MKENLIYSEKEKEIRHDLKPAVGAGSNYKGPFSVSMEVVYTSIASLRWVQSVISM